MESLGLERLSALNQKTWVPRWDLSLCRPPALLRGVELRARPPSPPSTALGERGRPNPTPLCRNGLGRGVHASRTRGMALWAQQGQTTGACGHVRWGEATSVPFPS